MHSIVPDIHMHQQKKRSLEERLGRNQSLNATREGSGSPMREHTMNVREAEEINDSPKASNISRDSGPNKYAKVHSYSSAMDTDSPASYPKHVIVPSPPDSNDQREHHLGPNPSGVEYMDHSPLRKKSDEKVVTPILGHERRHHGRSEGYNNVPTYRPQGGGQPPRGDGYGYGYYNHGEIETVLHYGHEQNMHTHPKCWVCDYCQSATFMSYEDACAHEEACAARYGIHHRQRPYSTNNPHAYPTRPPSSGGATGSVGGSGGLGTLYQASQEVHHYSPRMPPPLPHHESYHYHTPPPPSHRYPPPPPPTGWGAAPKWVSTERVGNPTLSPRFHDYRTYDDRHDNMGQHHPPNPNGYTGSASSHTNMNNNPNSYHLHHHHQQHPQQHQHHPQQHQQQHPHHYDPQPPRLLLALPGDADSLSDRQCYVRSKFVEIFSASDKDVASRHSKGAQKLTKGQVGIRCIHCAHLRAKDRAERAICYPSSISRIYQTVADMQRFHFEHCQEIPDSVRKIYKSLKTTRPRGVGSPQTYWIQSAKLLNLVDSEDGIFFGNGKMEMSINQDN